MDSYEFTPDYLAGYFDGEGCVSVILTRRPNQKSPRYLLQACVVSTDLRALRGFLARFGGQIFVMSKGGIRRSPSWRWAINCENAAKCLEVLIGRLVVKRHDAEIGLEFHQLVRESKARRGYNRRGGLTAEELAAREQVRMKLVTRHGFASRADVTPLTNGA